MTHEYDVDGHGEGEGDGAGGGASSGAAFRIPSRPLRVAAVQMESVPGDKAANVAKVAAFAAEAAAQGVQIAAFPECCLTGYWFLRHLTPEALDDLAEPIGDDGWSTRQIRGLAREHGVGIGAGLIERASDGTLYNSYIVALPDGALHRHRKVHAFVHPRLACGTEYTVFDTPFGWRVGVLICYDNNVNENGRLTALLGAQVLLAPHQTGGCRASNPHLMGLVERARWDDRHANPEAIEREFRGDKGRGWLMRWLPSRAHDNGTFLVFANGVGVDDDEIRTGNAMVLDPYGRILDETWKAEERMVVSDLDPALLAQATGREWIAARRPELYGPLTQRTGLERDVRVLKQEE